MGMSNELMKAIQSTPGPVKGKGKRVARSLFNSKVAGQLKSEKKKLKY